MKTDNKVQERVDYLIDRMSQVLGIEIPKREYPLVILTNENSSYNPDLNYIRLRESDKDSGEVLGHELGHFFRNKIKQQEKEKPLTTREKLGRLIGYKPRTGYEAEETHSDEFFGYLGTRILNEIMKERSLVKFGEKREPVELTREYILAHKRPSIFANQLDLSRIADLHQLFSLPDREVRHRFFRSDPQYNLSRPAPEAKITRRQPKPQRLESLVKIISVLFIITAGFFLTKNNITGNAISELSINKQIPILAILIISVIFLLTIGLTKKRI